MLGNIQLMFQLSWQMGLTSFHGGMNKLTTYL